jgi:uncharacterized protein
MRDPQEPLSPEETDTFVRLLDEVGGRSLAFARGVFAAAATAPTRLEPTSWLSLLLAQEPPDRASLKELMGLALREYNACAECLSLGVPAVPAHGDLGAVEQFCKGYIRVSQGDTRWTRDTEAFALTVPLAALAGYLEAAALEKVAPDAVEDYERWRAQRAEALADDVAALYRFWEEARNAPPPATPARPRVGRNEPCPCGSGKKYKRCCGAS